MFRQTVLPADPAPASGRGPRAERTYGARWPAAGIQLVHDGPLEPFEIEEGARHDKN